MTAVTLNFGRLADTLAVCAAVIAAFSCLALARGVPTLLVFSHGVTSSDWTRAGIEPIKNFSPAVRVA